jgi:hypothetical protein
MSLTNRTPAAWIPHVTAWNSGLAWVGIQLVGVLAALSSNASGPLISVPNIPLPSIDATKTAAKVLLVAFALSMFLAGGSAHAAQKAPLQFTGDFAADAKANAAKLKAGASSASSAPVQQPADILQKLMDDISSKAASFISNVVDAINEADADASTLTNPSDPTSFRDAISHACYPAQVRFLQSLPQIQAVKAPAPYNLIVLFQRKRDLIAQIKAGLPPYLKVGCAALLGDEATIFAQTLGMIGVTVGAGALTGIFPAAAPVTLALPAIAGL